ncbi:MAG: late control protein [Deltaproteobacteria bacterium]|jgi:phage protein D|nr:late control protein [Deltaproteobacteria bacterium]
MRRASLSIIYEGVNISRDIAPDLLSFDFVENADGVADEISFSLADPNRLWQGPWSPEKGDRIRPVISCENWFRPDDAYQLACGEFEMDESSLSSGSGGDTVAVRAVPALVTSSLVGQKKTRSWEGASLERIAQDISSAAGLELFYRAAAIKLKRTDQRQESDLAFLQRLCTVQGCRLKISAGELIVFEGVEADALTPVELTRADGDSFQAQIGSANIYSKVEISFLDPKSGSQIRYEYTPTEEDGGAPKTGKILALNRRVENAAQAERVAKAELRKLNIAEKQAEWAGMGHPLLRAGGTAHVFGWGRYDGNYTVQQARHNFSGGGAYSTSVTLGKALGY